MFKREFNPWINNRLVKVYFMYWTLKEKYTLMRKKLLCSRDIHSYGKGYYDLAQGCTNYKCKHCGKSKYPIEYIYDKEGKIVIWKRRDKDNLNNNNYIVKWNAF